MSETPVPENYELPTLITLMRIYDVLITKLQATHPEAALKLMELHASGKLVASAPNFTGEFAYDLLNNSDPNV